MVGKGTHRSTSKVPFIIPGQVDKTHRNAKIYGRISDYLCTHGHQRSLDQRWDKVEEEVVASVSKSTRLSEEREKFSCYNNVDQMIGHKPPGRLWKSHIQDQTQVLTQEVTSVNLLCGE